ncbi:uncharacterized protein LOC130730323 [Lotus japonicus]|uniref:uncharacterized protein LOC130730323 n=1 Tax=Lotus japonicus TaxID=34305 RepID=UPI00258F745A|nr:uncharacterized protein LOC130730323 [Lotus japonicus]
MGGGGVLINSHGNWVLRFSYHGKGGESLFAELGALRVGLELGWKAGHRKLVVELDYSDVLAALEDLNCGDFIPEIEVVRCLISRNWEVRLRVIPRDYNRPTDWLAKHGASAPD